MSAAGPQFHAAIGATGTTRLHTVRSAIGEYVAGRWVLKNETDTQRRMMVSWVSPSDRKLLPEGMRTEDSVSISCAGPLNLEAAPGNGGATTDRVLYSGWWWRVVSEVAIPEHGRFRYLAVRDSKEAEDPPT